MGYSEFIEWQAFYDAEPFGDARGDIQTAMLATVIANVNRSKKAKKIKFSQFLIDWWHDKSKPQAIMAKFRAIVGDGPVAKQPTNGTRVRNTRSSVSRRD